MDLKVICLEEPAFYALINEVVSRIKETNSITEKKWLTSDDAMNKLGIKSKTTLQKFRNEGKIRFTQPEKKIVLYDADSLNDFLSKNAHETF